MSVVTAEAHVLVLTPIKDAAAQLDRYFALLRRMTYPASRLSLGLLESDSGDGTFEAASRRLDDNRTRFRRAGIWRKDFGFRLPEGIPRWLPAFQIPRRTILAKSRNHLLMHALQDEDWVLW